MPDNCTLQHPSVRPGALVQCRSGDAVCDMEVEVEELDRVIKELEIKCNEQAKAEEMYEQIMGGESDGTDEASESAEDGDCDSGEHDRAHEDEPAEDPALGEEETEPPKVAAQPRLPGRDEVDVHEAMGHAQFRNWCEPCIYGQGREDLHLRGENGEASPW